MDHVREEEEEGGEEVAFLRKLQEDKTERKTKMASFFKCQETRVTQNDKLQRRKRKFHLKLFSLFFWASLIALICEMHSAKAARKGILKTH